MVALTRKRREVHGRYIGINYASTRNPLAGCINDVMDWRDAFTGHVSTEDVLLEEKATRANILRFVKEAIDLLDAGDWLVLQISGHGANQSAPGSKESDGKNEFFLPYDYDKGVIFDNDWYEVLSKKHVDSRVLFITDCCYSGTMARALRTQRDKPRFVPFEQVALATPVQRREALCRRRPRSEADGIADGVVHLSACTDKEVAMDAYFNRRANGAMSYYALESLRQLKPGATFLDWKRELGMRLPGKFKQSPQWNANDLFWDMEIPGLELDPMVTPPSDLPPDMRVSIPGWEGNVTWRRTP